MTTKGKIITTVSLVLVLGLAIFIFFKFCFVYSTGVNAGDINYFQKEGVIFKTYEGKMIQTGFRSDGSNAGKNNLRSNEWKFSVTDEQVAQKLMLCSGKHVELRWKRYLGTLPWRGNSQYIVYEIVSEQPSQVSSTLPPVTE
ncbi:MAG: hypothetical protein IJR13_06850 [Bacteroidales bacterium]|nr:hypothetical protein [Bacteroidales bacterium]